MNAVTTDANGLFTLDTNSASAGYMGVKIECGIDDYKFSTAW